MMNPNLYKGYSKAGIFLLLIFSPFIFSCQTPGGTQEKEQGRKLDMLSWLEGTWKGKVDSVAFAEIWKRVDDSTFSGTGMVISGQDTAIVEQLQLALRNDTIYYIATVSGQRVVFTMTSMTADRYVFENPAHDFPQVITYTKVSEDSLVAEITGMVKGERRREVFKMVK